MIDQTTITEEIAKLKTEICDFMLNLCAKEYSKKYDDPDEAVERLEEERCSKCPLKRL